MLEDRGLEVCFVNTGKERIELIAPTRDDSEVSGFRTQEALWLLEGGLNLA